MEFEPHPQATQVMDEFKKFSDVLEGAMKQQGGGSFAGTDEAETVEVVINGAKVITQLYIEDGLLRLGAETVEQRINEALRNANAEAAASLDAIAGETFESLSKVLGNLQKVIEED